MTNQYTILLRNLSAATQPFYVFQKQAVFLDPGAITTPLTNSLGSRSLAPYSGSGAQLNFSFDSQVYAGAVSTMTSAPTTGDTSTSPSTALFSSTQSEAYQPVTLSQFPGDSMSRNQTTLGLYPLSLSIPVNVPNENAGYFSVQVPAFAPSTVPQLYCGNACLDSSGIVTLSSYVNPTPNVFLYCSVQPVYYVKVGNYSVGTRILYDTKTAAACSFLNGVSTILVTYNPDGTFCTQPTA